MSRFIDADAYIEANACCGYLDEISVDKFNEITPTADVRENVHGKWIERCEIDGGFGATCNVCGEYCSLQYTDDRKFCPNCGADMRKEVEE